jgi:hypothetical protein
LKKTGFVLILKLPIKIFKGGDFEQDQKKSFSSPQSISAEDYFFSDGSWAGVPFVDDSVFILPLRRHK